MENLNWMPILPPCDGSSWGLALWGAWLETWLSFVSHQAIPWLVLNLKVLNQAENKIPTFNLYLDCPLSLASHLQKKNAVRGPNLLMYFFASHVASLYLILRIWFSFNKYYLSYPLKFPSWLLNSSPEEPSFQTQRLWPFWGRQRAKLRPLVGVERLS